MMKKLQGNCNRNEVEEEHEEQKRKTIKKTDGHGFNIRKE